ncbi:aspartate/glutamate racemase family protein [Actibacterium sp. MT2.3-13A]|uniref:maleate cis-trans isomerase family protein n=1 Tax=Actibacterium sp. MT2.3-13A TaxID=2828332 RepID=UPI001BA88D21|nr:aspartate/glutamate racemase family protein [Actibacterium sp. MT2.3-13A]
MNAISNAKLEEADRRNIHARLGMLVPSGNILAEDQVRALLPASVALHVTRLPLTHSSDDALRAMIEGLPQSAAMLADARVDVIAFNCTAVSTRKPGADADIVRRIENATGTPALTTGDALVQGLRALGCSRIALVTPYVAPVVEREAAYFRHYGFEVLSATGSGIDTNWDMAKERPELWFDCTLAQKNEAADAYVLSCTAIRTLSIIGPLEETLGRPVLTSNQAITWLAMRRLGAEQSASGAGRLFRAA